MAQEVPAEPPQAPASSSTAAADAQGGEQGSAADENVDGEAAGQKRSPLMMALLHVKWAGFLQKAGQHERAAEHYSASLQLCPSSRAHFGLGTCLASLRRLPEALASLEEALAMSPSMVGAHINAAGVLLAMRRFQDAADHCKQALDLEPGSREAVMNLANALRYLERRGEAVDLVWRHILKADGADAELAVEIPSGVVICSEWTPSRSAGSCPLAVVCVKWGKRYDAAYVNRLAAGARRHLPGPLTSFICFTDDPAGLDAGVEARLLPDGLPLWWGKAYLFSEEAGLDGHRVLFLDLDQVIVGSLQDLASYSGPFALLATDGISCEFAKGGYNSSVISWEASPFFRPIYALLGPAVLKYVHRFDHWLEMVVRGADLWQEILPGRVVDYTAVFRNGVCLGHDAFSCSAAGDGGVEDLSQAAAGCFAPGGWPAPAADEAEAMVAGRGGSLADSKDEPPPLAAVVTFPRSPKPHEVVDLHDWVRRHWLGELA